MKERDINPENPEVVEFKGKGILKQQWMSVCSIHRVPDKWCKNCSQGNWANVFAMRAENVFYKLFPNAWRFMANRKK